KSQVRVRFGQLVVELECSRVRDVSLSALPLKSEDVTETRPGCCVIRINRESHPEQALGFDEIAVAAAAEGVHALQIGLVCGCWRLVLCLGDGRSNADLTSDRTIDLFRKREEKIGFRVEAARQEFLAVGDADQMDRD